jgi:hypothetical protein
VSVSYETRNNTATASSDYVAKAGMLTIPAGATKASISIAVKGDTVFERNERFKLRLSNPVGATLGAGRVRGKIFNDDRRP